MICAPWDTIDCCDVTPSDDVLMFASEVLFALSGRQFPGICTETIRPCAGRSQLPPNWPYPWYPTRFGGKWLNIGCGCHIGRDCSCGGVPQVDLGRHDVQEIYKVDIAGTTLSSSAYRLDEGRWLVRTDGEQWPCCQDLSKDIGEAGTWYIELAYGTAPPTSGQLAVSKFACEIQKACDGDSECKLPARVTTVARQGVTFTVLDPQDFLTDGRTGLLEVDFFLKAVNPNGLQRRASAWSPGMPGRARRVGVLGS